MNTNRPKLISVAVLFLIGGDDNKAIIRKEKIEDKKQHKGNKMKIIINKNQTIGNSNLGASKMNYDEIEVVGSENSNNNVVTVHLYNLNIGKLTLYGNCVVHIYGTYVDTLESEPQCTLIRHTWLPAATSKVKNYSKKYKIQDQHCGLYSDTIDP